VTESFHSHLLFRVFCSMLVKYKDISGFSFEGDNLHSRRVQAALSAGIYFFRVDY
jgi:hypothetical protein